MFVNSLDARRLLGSLGKRDAPPAKDDYSEYSSDSVSTDSETFAEPPATKKKVKVSEPAAPKPRAPKAQKAKKAPAALPPPPPPPPVPAVPTVQMPAAPPAVKEKKARTPKKVTAPEAPVVALPSVSATPPAPAVSAKTKRAPSEYNKFVSQHMKGGLAMSAVAALWKSEKAKAKSDA